MSLHNFDADGQNPLIKGAHAEADSSGGSLLLSAAGSEGTAYGSATLQTYVDNDSSATPTTITAGGGFSLISKANNRAYAEAPGFWSAWVLRPVPVSPTQTTRDRILHISTVIL